MAQLGNWTINQLGTVLNAINAQSTGATQSIAITDTGSFVSVAQKTLSAAGYDKIMGAISQVLSKTIFSYRPYSAKFGGLYADSIRYGNHVRKIQPIDTPFDSEDQRYDLNGSTLADGDTVDQYQISKPKVLQTNIYSQNVYQKHITIFKEQLDTAFSDAGEFGSFLSMIMQNLTDQLEQAREGTARATVQNFIGGKIKASNNVVHLVTLYNAETGSSLTSSTVFYPENYPPFVKWFKGYLETLRDRMEERTQLYHVNIAGNVINRHSPRSIQKLYLYGKLLNDIRAQVLPDVFNDKFLDFGEVEGVNFWQNINEPMKIAVKASYLNAADGSVSYDSTGTTTNYVAGVLFDREAMGYTVINEYMANSPMNARGAYYNVFANATYRYWNDFTENAVVFLMD